MIEQGLVKQHFVGRDGFIWWIGQIVSETYWAGNLPGAPTETTEEQKGFGFRYKVRIMGYHTACPTELPDEDLPWASVMLPVTAGTSGGAVSTPNLRRGNFVYGFFIDGEDAQQPVIMGVIGYNQYTAILKDAPEKEDCGFKPFSGYTVDDTVPKNAQPTTQEKAEAVAEDVNKSKTNNDKVAESATSVQGREDGASLQQKNAETKDRVISSTNKCKPAPIGPIQNTMRNFLADVEEVKKSVTDWETKVSTTVDDVEREIGKLKANAIMSMSGNVKLILTEVEKNVVQKVNDSASEVYGELFPTELPQVKEEMMKINDELACLFKNIMKNLTSMIGGFLDQILDRFVTTPLCAVENFLGSLLGKISGIIDSALGAIMQPLKSLLAGMGAATDALDDVMGFASDALSLLTCDVDPNCSQTETWNPLDGAKPGATLDLDSIFDKAKSAADSVKGALDGVANIGDAISGIADSADFSDVFQDSCNVGPVFCGPPIVEFIGGGGSGATGNVIVSSISTILGVDIITPGGGYIGAPRIRFIDSCDKGRGANARAIVSGGQVVQVVMDDSGTGYLPAPDGSQGGDGRTWANPDDTVVLRDDDTYDYPPYKPGTVIKLNPGDTYTSPGGSPVTVTEPETITTQPRTDDTTKGKDPSTNTGKYPVVLEMEDINIIEPGFGYDCSKDKVVMEPANGCEFRLKCDPVGSITKVDVVKGCVGFTEDPKIYIESDSGYNCKLMPVFKVNRIGKDTSPKLISAGGTIQVIDCVGKF